MSRGALDRLSAPIAVLALFGVTVTFVRWDPATRDLYLWRIPFKVTLLIDGGEAGLREHAIQELIRETLSWWWLVVVFLYVLPTLLLPLARSFSIEQMLWLRLAPCTARDIAAARACRVIVAALSLTALSALFASASSIYHATAASDALLAASEVGTHVVLACGILLILAPSLSSPTARLVCAFVALSSPMLLYFTYAALESFLPAVCSRYWPYVVPFEPFNLRGQGHTIATAAVGTCLLVTSVFIQPAAITQSDFVLPRENQP
jgi:hypothetical protein